MVIGEFLCKWLAIGEFLYKWVAIGEFLYKWVAIGEFLYKWVAIGEFLYKWVAIGEFLYKWVVQRRLWEKKNNQHHACILEAYYHLKVYNVHFKVVSGRSRISPRRGCQLSKGAPKYDFAKLSQKLHEIERIWSQRERMRVLSRVPRHPPPFRSAAGWFHLLSKKFFSSFLIDLALSLYTKM